MIWVKICGTTNLEDARAAVEAGADALGFVFATSPRRIEPDAAKKITAALPQAVSKIGVFVNETRERIAEIASTAGLTGLQLHGDESLDFVAEVRKLMHRRLQIFKALAADTAPGKMQSYAKAGVDALLLDSMSEAMRGGTGKTFDWTQAAASLPQLAKGVRLVLAGGLNPENVSDAIHCLHPWGVDVCSGVECSPGRKDAKKLNAFVSAARSTAVVR